MSSKNAPSTDLAVDPTLAIAERQLVMLAELAEMAMTAARAFTTSAIAAAKAEAMILSEEWFTPEVGRARACGAKDAAESLQKVLRAVRLTLKLEMKVAEIARDIRAGKVTYINGVAGSKDAGETPAHPDDLPVRRRPAGFVLADTPDRDRNDYDNEPLVEFDRPDRFPRALHRPTFEPIDREDASVLAAATPGRATFATFDRTEGVALPGDRARTAKRTAALSP